MTDATIALLGYLRKIGADLDGDFLREACSSPGLSAQDRLKQMLFELDAEDQIGAAK